MTTFRCEMAIVALLGSVCGACHQIRNDVERAVQEDTPAQLRSYLATRVRDRNFEADLIAAGFVKRSRVDSDGCQYYDYNDPSERARDAYVRVCSNGTWFADVGQPFDEGNLRI